MWFSLQQWQVSQHTINLWLKSQLHRPMRISVTINLFYNSILRAIYMTKENADISRFSKILQPGVKVYKCQKKYHYQKLTFIFLFWFLIKNRFIQKKKKPNAKRNVSIYSWYFCYQFDNKIKRLYMFESKTRILM